ncbi:MAG: SDR family NAD(P)-dependent oxidoreductase [Solirubrobacteraceae bacterium]
MAPRLPRLGGLVSKPVDTVGRVANTPIGNAGRFRPLYAFNLVDRIVNGTRTLEDTVHGKVIVITGASSGIGKATALELGRAGATVLLVARGQEALDETQAEIEADGGTAFAYSCDLTDYDAIDALCDRVLDEHGRVDVLINNAGRSIRRSMELSYDRFHDFERTMQLNYFAPVRLILRLLPGMRERGEGQVINISSIGVQARAARFGAYIASKAALDTLSDAVQAEAHSDGVRFTTIHMPLVRTPMLAPTKAYDRVPTLSPEQAAAVITSGIVHRPRRLGSPIGHAAAFVDAINPQLMDILRNRGYQLFPDSKAAQAAGSTSTRSLPPAVGEEELTRAGQAFARVTRGVHW